MSKKSILLLVLALIFLVGGIYIMNSGIVDEMFPVNEGNKQKEEVPTVTEDDTLKIEKKNDWVFKAKYETDEAVTGYTDGTNVRHTLSDIIIPYININSSDAKKVNEELKTFYDAVMKGYIAGSKNPDGSTHVSSVNYLYYNGSDFVTIFLTYDYVQKGIKKVMFKHYAFNKITGKRYSYQEFITKYGLTKEKVNKKVNTKIEDRYSTIEFNNATEKEQKKKITLDAFNKTVANDSIVFYVNKFGRLCVNVPVVLDEANNIEYLEIELK